MLFDLDTHQAYQAWRQHKQAGYPIAIGDLIVPIANPRELSVSELHRLAKVLAKTNFVIYQAGSEDFSKSDLHQLALQFGLQRFDKHLYANEGVSEIRVSQEPHQGEFIPYTSRKLGWHTDGYYSDAQQWVSAILLHCNCPAESGGENQLADPEMLYIYLRDQDPDYISVLMEPDCMTIPGFDNEQGHSRAASHGPVFWLNENNELQMRYTQRKTNIGWREDDLLSEARSAIDDWLASSASIFTHTLSSGQGVLSKNVLHNRSAFTDSPEKPRRMLRARYRDSIKLPEEKLHD